MSRVNAPAVAGMALASAFLASSVQARETEEQTRLDDVVVVAQKREERLQDVPVAVSVVQGKRLEELGLQTFEQLSRYVPNLTVADGASGNRITVRGISSGTNRGFEQSVGLFVDGVYAGRARQFSVPFFDVERVEVLKGPQGVLFGKNTVAGAISLLSAQPTAERHVELGGAYEARTGATEATAILSGPISDNLSARLALRHSDADDGQVYNSLSKTKERGVEDNLGRLTLAWTPSDAFKLVGKYEYSKSETTGSIFQLVAAGNYGALFAAADPTYETKLDRRSSIGSGKPSTNVLRATNASVRADWSLGAATLVSQTGYSAFKASTRDEDSDFTPANVLTFNNDEDFWQFSQELRVESSFGKAVTYVAGVYYQRGDYRAQPENIFNGSVRSLPSTRNRRDFDQSSTSYSGFAEATWRVSPALRLIAGARYNVEDKDVRRGLTVLKFDGSGPETSASILAFSRTALASQTFSVRQSRTEKDLSPSLTVQYDLAPGLMAYAKANRASKAGGFDASDTLGTAKPYEDERVTAYEGGLKSSFGAAELNLAVYSAEFKDLQVQAFNGVSFQTTNAAKARSRGVELDGRWRLSPEWLLSGGIAYLSARYVDYTGAACTTSQTSAFQASGASGSCVQDLSGRPLTDAPDWSASANLNHRRALARGWSLNADLGANFRSKAYVAPDLDPIGLQGAYTTWDTSLQLIAPEARWSVSLVARNLFDKYAMTYLVNAPLLSGAKSASMNEPRTVELRLRAKF